MFENQIALSSRDDKRLQTFNRVTTYPYGTNAFKVCESEMMTVRGLFVENFEDFHFMVKQYSDNKNKKLSKI